MVTLDTNPHPVLDDLVIDKKEDPCLFFYYSVMIPNGYMTTLIQINRMKPEICKVFVKILKKTSFDRRASALDLLKTYSKNQ